MKLIRFHALALLVVITMALPSISETWGCRKWFDNEHPHLIELVSDLENEIGSIQYDGLPTIHTIFYVDGFTRIWGWSDDLANLDNVDLFAIQDNIGYHYSVRSIDDNPKPEQTYKCHKH